jgi:hypothetical protein
MGACMLVDHRQVMDATTNKGLYHNLRIFTYKLYTKSLGDVMQGCTRIVTVRRQGTMELCYR